MVGRNGDDGAFFQSIPKKSTGKKRLYVGNLPAGIPQTELENKLIALFKERGNCFVAPSDVSIHHTKACHAIVSCSGNVDSIIRNMNRSQFEGKRIIVQRERKRKDFGAAKKTAFSGSSWSKPASEETAVTDSSYQDPTNEDREMQNSKDPVGTTIAGTAAIGRITSAESANEVEIKEPTVGDFLSQFKKPMADLMADYGEQDLNWKQVQPTASADDVKETQSNTRTDNKLMKLGKAPIHIEFSSFGYYHGVPADLREGWSHANPLAAFDCRDLEPVPQYLSWQDGLSGAVKRALMFPRRNEDASEGKPVAPSIRKVASDIGEKVAASVIEAINEGGHGYASPLQMVIFIGSESGRHRSVVLCELAATALRKLLRANKDGRFSQPCSVGTKHRDVERKNAKPARSAKSKQQDLEDDF